MMSCATAPRAALARADILHSEDWAGLSRGTRPATCTPELWTGLYRRVGIRIEAATLMFFDLDSRELLRTRPNPFTVEQIG